MSGKIKNKRKKQNIEPISRLRRNTRNKSQLLEAEECNDNDHGQQNSNGPTSVSDICSICLEQIQDKCFANVCLHKFCYGCLIEWSKVRNFAFL